MINPKTELFRWGPIDIYPVYISPFTEAFVEFPKYYNGTWSDCIGYFSKAKGEYILDDAELRKCGENLFVEYISDNKKREKAYSEWEKTLKSLRAMEQVVNLGLAKLTDAVLGNLFKKWNKVHELFWVHGFIPELSNWGGEKLLKENILKEQPKHFIELFEALSAPEQLSFFQQEELDMLKIVRAKESKQETLLELHSKKYYWLRNSYSHTQELNKDFFRVDLLKTSRETAKKRIKEIKSYHSLVKKKKKAVIKKFKIKKEIVSLAKNLSYCVWWQDYRKKFIFIANHINARFMKEISDRTDTPFDDLLYYKIPELDELINKDKKTNIKKRKKSMLLFYDMKKNSIKCFEGNEAKFYVKPYMKSKIEPTAESLTGLVVSKGPLTKGRVKIVHSPKEMNHFETGDILVASMTSPDFIVAMRKAAAIITDEGGMTSHAAIVSRELKKPCIVNTKHATKVLKNSMLVEVDTERGIVKIIEKVKK